MKIRTVSWEIIIAGLFLTGIAIYVTKSSNSNDSRDSKTQAKRSFVTEEDSTHSIIIDLHNLNSLSQLDQLDKLDKLDKGTDVKTIVLDLGFMKKTIKIPDSLRKTDTAARRKIQAKLDSTFKSIPKDSIAEHSEIVAHITNHVLTMTSSSVDAVPSSETLIRSNTYSANGLQKVSVDTKGGRIQAIGSSGNQVRVFITTKKGTSKKEFNKKYNVSISNEGGEFKVTLDQPNSGWSFLSWFTGGSGTPGNVIVEMPANLTFYGESKGGTIKCEHLKNGLNIKTLGGKLVINDVQGDIQAKTLGGDVEAHTLNGNADLKSMGGNIVVGNTNGNMNLKTAGGNISLDNLRGGSIDAETAGGNIDANFSTTLTNDLTLKTPAGNITVSLPESTKAVLDIKGMKVSIPQSWSISGSFDSNHIEGSLNGGSGPRITAHTSAGSVTIK